MGKNSFSKDDEDEDESIDFQKMAAEKEDDTNNKRKREESSSDDDEDDDKTEDIPQKDNGRKTMSIDQSLFSIDERKKSAEETPKFSCGSTIQMQASQCPSIGGDESEDDERQTATASQLDRVLMASSGKKSDMKSPPPSEKVPQLEVLPGSNRKKKKQHTSILTPPDKSMLGKKKQSPKRLRTTRVSFQQQPRVLLLDPSWKLCNAHTRTLRKCNDDFLTILKMPTEDAFDTTDEFDSGFDFDTKEGRDAFMAKLSSDRTANLPPAPLSFYAVSTEKDEELAPFGSVVPRSFPYYLSVACGLPIVDIEFLSSAANKKRQGTMSHQRYPFPHIPGADDTTDACPFLVLGASDHKWNVPQYAYKAAMDRHNLWQKEEGPNAKLDTLLPGTDMLHDYSILLLGEFDQPNHSKRTGVKKRKDRNSEATGVGYCTRGNITLLLQLCGAQVYDIDNVVTSKHIKKGLTEDELTSIKNAVSIDGNNGETLNDSLQSASGEGDTNKVVVMVRDRSDLKLGIEFINQLTDGTKASQIPVVSCQWLLDCIGDFEGSAQETVAYEQSGDK